MDSLVESMQDLNKRRVPFLLSFDGRLGDKTYGTDLPDSLSLFKINVHVGKSSQATLLGRDEETVESLYLSPHLIDKLIITELQTDVYCGSKKRKLN